MKTATQVILVLGGAIMLIGTLFKIMHWPFANESLIVGFLLAVVGLIALFIVMARGDHR